MILALVTMLGGAALCTLGVLLADTSPQLHNTAAVMIFCGAGAILLGLVLL